jgi:hypothetical protein
MWSESVEAVRLSEDPGTNGSQRLSIRLPRAVSQRCGLYGIEEMSAARIPDLYQMLSWLAKVGFLSRECSAKLAETVQ